MNSSEKLQAVDLNSLRVIHYPDPRLKVVCTEVAYEDISETLRNLAFRMTELMFASRGVGLAAPQVGVTIRMFISSPEFQPEDCHVYINPKILALDGSEICEEGCLSFPQIYCKVKRAKTVTVQAMNLEGEMFTETATDLAARIIQHENDHLNGMLLSDRMSTVAKLANRKTLHELEAEFAAAK